MSAATTNSGKFYALFTVAMIVLGIALLEAVCRVLDPMGISYYPDTARYMDSMIIEEPIGYRNRPNLSDEFYGARVTTNSLGLRHPEIEAVPNQDVHRILFLGDSVVFGVGVEQHNTLPAQLERSLSGFHGLETGNPIEVVNMGCISYNTEQELIQYQQLGQSFKPNLILLMFSSNDIEPKMWIFDRRKNPFVSVAQKSHAISFLFLVKRRLQALLSDPGSDTYIQWSAYESGHPQWQMVEDSLITLQQLAKSQEIPLVLLGQGHANKSWNMVSQLAAKQGFEAHLINPFVDKRWAHLDPTQFFAKRGGGHLGAEGLGMYTQQIHELLLELNLVKSSVQAQL